ncbi:MAG: RluA family pseudouridine synthase [Solobacterium sp.]|nr:RluA family pseudouridine synthase [Solobacterium sp.]
MSDYTVRKEQAGLAVKTLLAETLGLSRREISRLNSARGILVNGESVRLTEILSEGDAITLVFAEKDLKKQQLLDGKPEILYEDRNLVIVNKPCGMPCHASKEHQGDDMGTVLQKYYGNSFRIRPVGRLDKEVSGAMLYAKNQNTAKELSKDQDEAAVRKEYLAFVEGSFHQKRGNLSYFNDDGKHCSTDYELVEKYDGYSLLKVRIKTGRTHQIREGMARFSHPLLGDARYGGSREKIARTALHCARITIKTGKDSITVTCPMPSDMEALRQ